jgi:hypothetical protein
MTVNREDFSMKVKPVPKLSDLPNEEAQRPSRSVSPGAAPPIEPPTEPAERLVKSSDRVRDIGEVFTPAATVNEMLDLLPRSMWAVHPSPTFLEPSCGDGNFLIAILDRKLRSIGEALKKSKLPAGEGASAASFHALEALASIYAVDISSDNIIGGIPGHEIGARTRLLQAFICWHKIALNVRLSPKSPVLRAAEWVVEHNLIVGNMLPVDSDGKPTGRNEIPLIEYEFTPAARTVQLRTTTLGDAIATAHAEYGAELSLFGPVEPAFLWEGKALQLANASRVEAPSLRGPARNGKGSRRK